MDKWSKMREVSEKWGELQPVQFKTTTKYKKKQKKQNKKNNEMNVEESI